MYAYVCVNVCMSMWMYAWVIFSIVIRVMRVILLEPEVEKKWCKSCFFSLFIFVIDSSSSYGYLGLDRSGCYLREIKPLLVPTVGVISNSTNRGKWSEARNKILASFSTLRSEMGNDTKHKMKHTRWNMGMRTSYHFMLFKPFWTQWT